MSGGERAPRPTSGLRKAFYVLAANALGLGLLALALEGAGRLFLWWRPSYDVLFLEPDRSVGWKQVPGLRFRWTGTDWYAADFSVAIQVNGYGFRDAERSPEKPAGVVRLALLGDSFVEAMQVPLERTAAQRLERRLAARGGSSRFEVLNFGISNYGLGQYLLVWEEYVRRFDPDYVFAFVGEWQIRRTTRKHETGGFRATADRRLWVRPVFRLEGGSLVREPARDFDAFVALQQDLIRSEFGGARSRVRETSVARHYLGPWLGFGSRLPSAAPAPEPDPPLAAQLPVNLAVLDELHRQVRSAGASLVVVDASGMLSRVREPVSSALRRWCAAGGAGYADLAAAILAANARGVETHWRRDGHLNDAGNRMFADVLADWMERHPPARSPRGAGALRSLPAQNARGRSG